MTPQILLLLGLLGVALALFWSERISFDVIALGLLLALAQPKRSNLTASFDMELVLKLMIELGHDELVLECLERMIRMCQVLENVSDYRE